MMKILSKLIETVIVIIVSLMVLFLFGQIILRSFFDYSLQWADEFARYGMIWTTFLGCALVVKDRSHIKVEFFLRLLPASMYKYVNVLINLLVCVFIAVLIYNSTSVFTEAMKQSTPGLGISYGMVVLSFPVGGILMMIYLLYDCVKWLKKGEVV